MTPVDTPAVLSPAQGSPRRAGMSLHMKIGIGLALGVGVGLALSAWGDDLWRAAGVNDPGAYLKDRTSDGSNADAGVLAALLAFAVNLTQFVGDLFVRCLRLIAAPIVLFSLVVAVASMPDMSTLRRVGIRTCVMFLMTCLGSVAIGLGIANAVRPGATIDAELRDTLAAAGASDAAVRIEQGQDVGAWRLVLDLVPANPFRALADGNMVQIVTLALLLGLALASLPRARSEPAFALARTLSDSVITFVHWLMKLAPLAVFALIAPVMATLGVGALTALAAYCLSVLAGLAVVLLVLYPAVLVLFTRMPVGTFFRGIAPAQSLAFSSSSSAATLPVTITCVRERLGVPDGLAGFVCSLGTTVNMDGTALMQSIAAVFIAQLYGVELSLSDQAIIALTATLAAVGSPGIPSSGIVMLVVVLESVGIPLEGIGIILAVDRVLDMARTVVNVTGDALAAVYVASAEGVLGAAEDSPAAIADNPVEQRPTMLS